MPQTHADKQPEIQALLAEIMALAIRLRQGVPNGQAELPPGGQQVLEILFSHGDQTVPQIARLRGTSRQNIQILVNRLHADECVDLVSNPSHKRSCLVRATEKGKKLLLAARRANDTSFTMLSSLVPAAELRSTTETLRRIRQTFGDREVALPESLGRARVKKKTVAARPRAAVAEETFSDENQFPVNLL